MNSKLLGALAAVALLAACETTTDTAATGAGARRPPGTVPGSQEDLVANVGDRVFFDFDRSTLKSDARSTLERQAAWLAKYPQRERAGGRPLRRARHRGVQPGARPAPRQSGRDYLVARGVAGARVSTISYGKDRPTALG